MRSFRLRDAWGAEISYLTSSVVPQLATRGLSYLFSAGTGSPATTDVAFLHKKSRARQRALLRRRVDVDAKAARFGELDRVGDHRHWLNGGVQSELALLGAAQSILAYVVPDIGPVPAPFAQCDIVDVRFSPDLEYEDEFVL